MGIKPIPVKWASIPLHIRAEFFSPWAIYSLIGDILVIIGCLLAFIPNLRAPFSPIELLVFGIGNFIVCSRITEYLKIFKTCYTLFGALRFAIIKIILFTLSLIPIFLGFAILGTLLFGPFMNEFSSLGSSMIVLYSFIMRDNIYNTFMTLDQIYPYPAISGLYIFLFSFFSLVAFLNVFIFIMNDAYYWSKMVLDDYYHSTHTLYNSPTKYIHILDLEKLFLAIDMELEPLSMPDDNDHHTLYNSGTGDFLTNNNQNKNPLLNTEKSKIDPEMPPELIFVDSLRRGAYQKAELSRTSLKPNSTQMTGYVPLTRKSFKKRISESDEDTGSDIFLKLFDKHKIEFEKNFEKSKQIFLENLRKELLQLTRNSIVQSVREPSIIPPDETSMAEHSGSEPPLPRLGVFPGTTLKPAHTSSRTEDSALSRNTVT